MTMLVELTETAVPPPANISDEVLPRQKLEYAADLLGTGSPIILCCSGRTAAVYSATEMNTEQMAELVKLSTGFVEVALPEHVCDRLLLAEATPSIRDPLRAAFGQCVTVDAVDGVTTGISAHDRVRTARQLCDPRTAIGEFTRPGHIVPVRATILPIACLPSTVHLATAALSLVAVHFAAPGAVYADLVSPINPCFDATYDDAVAVARELQTVAVRVG